MRDYVAPIQVYDAAPSATSPTISASRFLYLSRQPHQPHHHLEPSAAQTSDWKDAVGKPDWRIVGRQAGEWLTRLRNKAGTAYKYNDVRVNVLALAALTSGGVRSLRCSRSDHGSIGASNTWRLVRYENSWIVLDAASAPRHRRRQWGGGMFHHAYDMPASVPHPRRASGRDAAALQQWVSGRSRRLRPGTG